MYGSAEQIKKYAEGKAESYLKDFQIDWEFLKDKKVLDVGAAQGEFALAAKHQGVDVTSLEKSHRVFFEKNLSDQAPYVAGDLYHMPFQDETFDIALARYIIPYGSKKDVVNYLKEISRVLKHGGELRVMSAPFRDLSGKEIPLDFVGDLGLSVEIFENGMAIFKKD